MTADLEAQIRGLLGAHPRVTEEGVQACLDSWVRYFETYRIREAQQSEEFNAIMRARVQSGVISVMAPSTGHA